MNPRAVNSSYCTLVACATLATAQASTPDSPIVEGTETAFAPIPMFFTSGGSIPPGLTVPVNFPNFTRTINGLPLVPLITIQQAYSANCDLDLAPRVVGGATLFAGDAFDPGNQDGLWFFGDELANLRTDPLLATMTSFKEEDHNYGGEAEKYDPPTDPCVVMTCNVGPQMLTGWPHPDSIAPVGDPLPHVATAATVVAGNGTGVYLVTGPLASFWKQGEKTPYEAWADRYGLAGDDRLPASDPDGDHATNLEEFEAGTDPTSPSSVPQSLVLALARDATTIQFSWTAQAGRTYDVLRADRVDAPLAGWTVVVTIAGKADGETATYRGDPPPGSSTTFYRVRSQ